MIASKAREFTQPKLRPKIYTKKSVPVGYQPGFSNHFKKDRGSSPIKVAEYYSHDLHKEMERLILSKYLSAGLLVSLSLLPEDKKGQGKKQNKKGKESFETNHLRQELIATREYLQSVVEEHEVANEELRSANEETLSANEELQAANEELTTVNEELQNRNHELKRNLAKLRESEERLRLFTSGVKDYAIFMLDPSGHIASWNSGAERITGYAADEVMSKHFSIFFPKEFQKLKRPEDELAMANRDGRFAEENWRLRKDGSRFWADVLVTALKDEKGKIRGFAKVTRDMTERKKAEESLQQAHNELENRVLERTIELARTNDELKKASQVKEEFTAMVSHELRTPLTAIKGGIEIVLHGIDGPLNESQIESLNIVKRSVDRLMRLIDEILHYQKIESGESKSQQELCDLNRVVLETAESFLPVAKEKGLFLSTHVTDALPSLFCEKDKIVQVLSNLINNAIRYSEKGKIVVKTEASVDGAKGTIIRVSVQDEGVGIHHEDRSKLFRSFSQLTRNKNAQTGGAGLGLVICKKIIASHHGEIDFESIYGKGSTFFFTLPVSKNPH